MADFKEEVQGFVTEFEKKVADLMAATDITWWEMAVSGTEEAVHEWEKAGIALRQAYADDQTFAQVREWYARRAELNDAQLRRQLEIIQAYFLTNWQDSATLEAQARLEGQVEGLYNNYRGVVQGQSLSDNDLEKILATSHSSAEVQEAYLASKEIGVQVAESVLQLVEMRNVTARKLGLPNHYQQALAAQELDETELFALLEELDRVTAEPFQQAKTRLDANLVTRFGLASTADLRPWHYGSPFFQRPPGGEDSPLEGVFADGQEIEKLTIKTYDGLGLEIRDVLARSDLYEKPGKSQHAFCQHIDRRTEDVRVVCNLQGSPRWMETNLHEFGHAVYDKYLSKNLPFWLRSCAHISTTEAIAMLMGRQATNKTWLSQIKGLQGETLSKKLAVLNEQQAFALLCFMRWGLVMVYFERDMYANPRRGDLNTLWWDYVERFQFLKRPEGRNAPDWAAKIHLATAPVYYQNYLLGELTASQLQAYIERELPGNALVENSVAGDYLRKLFDMGATYNWNETIREMTGELLTPKYFVEQALAV